jgi:hypothetical protein
LRKSVLIQQAENGYIVFVNRPIGYSCRVFNTWLEMFTEMGSYFAEGRQSTLGGICSDESAKCAESDGPRRFN